MESIKIKIADIKIRVSFEEEKELPLLAGSFKKRIALLFKGYEYNGSGIHSQVSVKYTNVFDVIDNNKTRKRFVGFYEQLGGLNFQTYYHISEQQFLIMVRDIIQLSLEDGSGVILHGSAVAKGKAGMAFLGDSGAGKSTIAALLSPQYDLLADDVFVIRNIKGVYYIYQTPFIQKNQPPLKATGRFTLGEIFFIEKGRETFKSKIADRENFFRLISQQLFTTSHGIKMQLFFLLKLSQALDNVYVLTFSKKNKQGLLEVLYE